MSVTLIRRALPVALAAALLALGGCSWLRADRTEYKGTRETRPLEVPPDLDAPPSATELTIPSTGSASRAPVATATPPSVNSAPPAEPSGAATPRPAPSSFVGTETSLALSDEIGSAWKRVSLALERSGVMPIVAKDEAAGTITLKQETVKREGGWFRKLIGTANTKTDTVTRVVHIVAEGAGTRVKVEDESGRAIEDESARQIIAAVKQRLG